MKTITLEKFENGWKFTVLGRHYRTNKDGTGLWQLARTGNIMSDGEPEVEWKQVRGLCQFSLPVNRKAAYSKIRREFSMAIEEYKLFGQSD